MTATDPVAPARCAWCTGTPELVDYHDLEWGHPVDDDRRLFEKLSLELFQSGLSWRTILSKRSGFRRAFHDFDFERIARYRPRDVERLLGDAGIVRHRGKIEAVITNARQTRKLVKEAGSLAAFVWRYEPDPKTLPPPQTVSTSPAATALSKDLKSRGFAFVGPTTVYAFMQAAGLINDHVTECIIRNRAERARRRFSRPGG